MSKFICNTRSAETTQEIMVYYNSLPQEVLAKEKFFQGLQ